MITDKEKIEALKKVLQMYGPEFAKDLESLFRCETEHFKSGNFIVTFSPGMEATKKVFPYGWTSLEKFWKHNAQYAPVGLHAQKENASAMSASRGVRQFIMFPSLEAAMMSVAKRVELKGGNFGAWHTNDADAQVKYIGHIRKAIPRFVNALIKTK